MRSKGGICIIPACRVTILMEKSKKQKINLVWPYQLGKHPTIVKNQFAKL